MLLRGKRGRIPAGAAAVVTALLAASAAAQGPPTNYDLVTEAAKRASSQLVERMASAGTKGALGLRSVGNHAGNFLVENALAGVLTGAGRTVLARADSSGPVLEFEVVDLGIAYTRVHRPVLVGKKRVEREARARIFARLVNAGRAQVLWADQAEAKVHDEVAGQQLGSLEDKGGADYLKATLPGRTWNKYAEPVVVTGIIVGLIALFYNNQNVK
jgi:hypothetical protein